MITLISQDGLNKAIAADKIDFFVINSERTERGKFSLSKSGVISLGTVDNLF